MTEQNQTNRKDAGKPRYDLLPTEEVKLLTKDSAIGAEVKVLCDWWDRKGSFDDISVTLVSSIEEVDGVVRVLEFGAVKYSEHGWERQPLTYSRIYRSAVSHALKEAINPGSVDEESGLPHVDHFRCNVIFAATAEQRFPSGTYDDRPTGILLDEPVEDEDEWEWEWEWAPTPCGDCEYCDRRAEPAKLAEVGKIYRVLRPHDDFEPKAVGQLVQVTDVRPGYHPNGRYVVSILTGLYAGSTGYDVGENAVLELFDPSVAPPVGTECIVTLHGKEKVLTFLKKEDSFDDPRYLCFSGGWYYNVDNPGRGFGSIRDWRPAK